MKNNYQQKFASPGLMESFVDRVDTLFQELELAVKWKRPSILLVVYSSEYVHADAKSKLADSLSGLNQKVHQIRIKSHSDADILSKITASGDPSNSIYFVDGLRWCNNKDEVTAYRALNVQRDIFIENSLRVVFWLTEKEAVDFAHYAPDFWAFRHRVIEFVEAPRPEQLPASHASSSYQAIWEFADTNDDLDEKISLRYSMLAELPPGDEATAPKANLLLTLGVLFWRRGDYEKATEFLNQALQLAPVLNDHWYEALCLNAIARVETDLDQVEEAVRDYQRALELAPDQNFPWTNLGKLYCRLDRQEEALQAFQKANQHNQKDLESWVGMGDIHCKLEQTDNAVNSYLKAIELAPEYAPAWQGIGNAYSATGKYKQAIAAYQKAIEIDGQNTSAWLGLGLIFKKLQSNETAITANTMATRIEPQNAHVWLELANLYYDAGNNDKAVTAYQKTIALDPACLQACTNLARLYEDLKKYPDAIALYQATISHLSDTEEKAILWNRVGDAYRCMNDYESALVAYRKADGQDIVMPAWEEAVAPADRPLEPEADSQPAPAPVETEEQEEVPAPAVLQVMDSVPEEFVLTTVESEFAQWLENLGTLSPNDGQGIDLPVEASGTAMEIGIPDEPPAPVATPASPEDDPAEIAPPGQAPAYKEPDTVPVSAAPARFHADEPVDEMVFEPHLEPLVPEYTQPALNRAAESILADDPVDESPQDVVLRGRKLAENLSSSMPDSVNAQIWNELGNIYYNSGASDEAIKAFNKAIELDEKYGLAYSNLATLFVHKGRYVDAIPLYKKGIELLQDLKDKALLWNHMGDAYRRLNDHESAVSAYHKAIELDPSNTSLLTRARFSLLGNCKAQ